MNTHDHHRLTVMSFLGYDVRGSTCMEELISRARTIDERERLEFIAKLIPSKVNGNILRKLYKRVGVKPVDESEVEDATTS